MFPFVALVIASVVRLLVVALKRPRKKLVHLILLNICWIAGLLILSNDSLTRSDPAGTAFLGIVLFLFGPIVAVTVWNRRRRN